jgi:DNA-binding PadR family transcriptional regulator
MSRDRMFAFERFFHGSWRESPFRKGDLKYVILDLIKDKPRYGYEIIRALEERSGGFYIPSPGVVYPTLQMLEEMGYASATELDGRKVYAITEEGRQYLSEHKDLADEIKSHMKHHWHRENMGEIGLMVREFMKLGKLMRHRLREAEPDKIRRIRGVTSRTYEEIKAILEE